MLLMLLSQSAHAAPTVDARSLLGRLDDFHIIDTRPSAHFNGWPEPGETAGGHVVGARHLAAAWLNTLSDDDLRELLEQKGIDTKKPVLLYGTPAQVDQVSHRLTALGWPTPHTLDGGLSAWIEHGMPMLRLPRYRQLVHPDWLAERMKRRQDQRPVLLEVAWDKPDAYQAAHIPGALYLDTSALEQAPLWNRVDDASLEQALLALGITAERQVVLYSRDSTAAARAAHLMLYAGVRDVRLLDGGLPAWQQAGYPSERGKNAPQPAQSFGRSFPAHPELMTDLPEARQILADPEAILVSVRSWDEYTGLTSGYDYIAARGRIDGATWGHGGSDADHMEDYRNPDNTLRAAEEVLMNWRQWGITPDKSVAFYCGTGWRASEAFFYAWLLGWQQISVFDGGWHEWSQDPVNPVASGDPLQGEESRAY